MNSLNLTVEEYCIQQRFSDSVIKEGVPYLIGLWERTARRITDYRHWCKDDYLNDLDARQILFEVMLLTPEVERASFEDQVAVADTQFIAGSVDSPVCVWGPVAEVRHQWTQKQNWWYYRLPKVVGPDF